MVSVRAAHWAVKSGCSWVGRLGLSSADWRDWRKERRSADQRGMSRADLSAARRAMWTDGKSAAPTEQCWAAWSAEQTENWSAGCWVRPTVDGKAELRAVCWELWTADWTD